MSDDFEAEERHELESLGEWRRANGGFDLLTADTSRPIPWVPGADGIIRKGERQSWVANFGEGKTQAAVLLSVQVAAAGGRVVYVDVENDKLEMAERFQPVFDAWDAREAWERRGTYLPRLDLARVLASDDLIRSWVEAIYPVDLLVIDSWTRVLSQFGYEEDSNRDVVQFMRDVIDPLADHGIAVLILDNTGHEGKRARGAVSKSATVEAVYKVTGGKAISFDRHGTLKLTRTRSRSGRLAEVVKGSAGGGEFERLAPAEVAEQDGRVEGRRLLVKQVLYERRGDEFTTNQVAAAVGGNPKTIGRDLEAMQADGTVQLRRQGNTKLWSAVSQ
jgi:KaiC/GvpD/RAD55 family RecA-like ATPase